MLRGQVKDLYRQNHHKYIDNFKAKGTAHTPTWRHVHVSTSIYALIVSVTGEVADRAGVPVIVVHTGVSCERIFHSRVHDIGRENAQTNDLLRSIC